MKINFRRSHAGYTFIEFVMTLSILAMMTALASIGYERMIQQSKSAIARNTLFNMSQIMKALRATGDKRTLLQMGVASCTDCVFRNGQPMKTNSGGLISNNQDWAKLGFFERTPIDPWGNPYSFDANEMEWSPTDCRWDVLESAGSDGIIWTADDITICLPHITCPENPPPVPAPCVGQ